MMPKTETEIIEYIKLGIFERRQKQSMLEIGCQAQVVFIN